MSETNRKQTVNEKISSSITVCLTYARNRMP